MNDKTLLAISLLCTLLLAAWSSGFVKTADSRPSSLIKVSLVSPTVIINEYLADPSATGLNGDANGDGVNNTTQDEFVEIVNFGLLPLDIGGFTVSDAAQVRFVIPAGKIIPAGEAAVIFGGGAPTGSFGNAQANGLVFAIGGAGLSLNNTGDSIIIKNAANVEVARRDYPPPASDIDQSLTRSPDLTGDFVAHTSAPGSVGRFSPGARVNGRPFISDDPVIQTLTPQWIIAGTGATELTINGDKFQNGAQVFANQTAIHTQFISSTHLIALLPDAITQIPATYQISVHNPDAFVSNALPFTVFSAIGINEFLADPPADAAGDANGDGTTSTSQDEFIEIINRTDAPVDASGFTLSDAAQQRFIFPAGTIIPANEAAVVFGGGTPTGEFGNASRNGLVFTAALSLNNAGDTITLKDHSNVVVEQLIYGSTEGGANQSLNRHPEIIGLSFALHSSLAQSAGALFSPGASVSGAAFSLAPRISELVPDNLPQFAEQANVAVHGSGFAHDSAVFIDDAPAPTQFVNADLLVATVPTTVTALAGRHDLLVRNAGGNRSNRQSLLIVPPPPQLIGVAPRNLLVGATDATLFVRGVNFEPTSGVVIEGSAVLTTFANPRELRAKLPATLLATTGTRRVKVRNGDGQESRETTIEIVSPSARLSALAPAQAIAGAAGFTLAISGANFQSGALVFFDQILLTTRRLSATALEAEVPAALIAEPGTRAVRVQNGDGIVSNDALFTVFPRPPVIAEIIPNSLIEGAGEVLLRLKGEQFQRGIIARVIEDARLTSSLETLFLSEQQLEVKLPARFTQKAGNLLLRVDNPDFGISNSLALAVLISNPLVINEYLADPPDGVAGDANGDGTRSTSQDEFIEIINRTSAPLDLSGYKLSDADAVRHIFAEGTLLPPREAVVVFGGGAPTGRFGNAMENRLVFKASSGGLSLNNSGDKIRLEDGQGRLIQEIVISASEGNAGQSLNRQPDVDGATFARHSDVARNAARLFSPGAKVNGDALTVKPAIRALTPATIHAGTSTFALALSGENFLPGAIILFGQTELVTTQKSSSELEAKVSATLISEGGAVDIRVRNPQGEISAAARFLIFEDAPRILTITPSQTSTGAEGFTVLLTGERFQRAAIAEVAGERVSAAFVSRQQLQALLPNTFFARAAVLEIRVRNEDGNLSNSVKLTIENGPLITRLSRKRLKAGSGDALMTIGGVAFKAGIVLWVNDAPVPTEWVSATEIRARLPATLTGEPHTLTLQAISADGGRSNRAIVKVIP